MKIFSVITILTLLTTPFFSFARTWPDTYYKDQDYLRDINVYPYDRSDAGEGLMVAIIGDGVQIDHTDYWSNVGDLGWNFIDDTSEITVYGSYDTAVAGIISATSDIKGTIGITPKTEIMSLVVCDASTCYQEDILEAITYAVDNGADVIGLTLGTVGGVMDYTTDYDEAIQYAYDNHVLVVGGMEPETDSDGNEVAMSPGCNDVNGRNTIIGVGSVDDYDDLETNCVDILAPYADILSAKVGDYVREDEWFEEISGLPLAIGIVTGVGILMVDLKSYKTILEYIDALDSTAENGLVNGTDSAMAVLKTKLDEVEFESVTAGDAITLTGEHLHSRLRFELTNQNSVIPLDTDMDVISPSEVSLLIPETVPSGTYFLKIDNSAEDAGEFEIINETETVAVDAQVTDESNIEDTPIVVDEVINLSDYAVAIAGDMVSRLAGYILLQVEQRGEAWYVNQADNTRYYLKNGAVAYEVMRLLGLGITNADLESIPSVTDEMELLNLASVCAEFSVANSVRGRILLQVEERGEAWYVHPTNCYRVYMQDGDSAYDIMRYLSLGITDADLSLMSE